MFAYKVRGQSGEVSSLQRDLDGAPGRIIVCRSDPVGTVSFVANFENIGGVLVMLSNLLYQSYPKILDAHHTVPRR